MHGRHWTACLNTIGEETNVTEEPADPRREPLLVHETDPSVRSGRLFAVNPVLAVHEGPWTLRQSPILGAVLIALGALALIATATGIIIDRAGETSHLGGNEIVGVIAVALFTGAMLIGLGRELWRGRVRHAPTGKKLTEHRMNLCGTPELGARIHAGLEGGTIATPEELRSGQRRGGWKIDLFVRFYEVPRTSLAYATVHFAAEEGVLVWPPVEISTDLVETLTYERYSEPQTNYLS